MNTVVFSPNGKWLATASSDATVRLWQLSTGKCRQILTGHTDWVSSVAYSPDGEWLATGSGDATIRVWQVSTGRCTRILTAHSISVSSVAFSPNGQRLATSSGDSTTRLWEMSTGECCAIMQIPRPYEGSDITNARGLTEAQRASMLVLGAVDHSLNSSSACDVGSPDSV
ncbi:MAG: hypothetical protein AAGF66_17000 [Cyanobacteria bacterium P01_H01_bin.119]